MEVSKEKRRELAGRCPSRHPMWIIHKRNGKARPARIEETPQCDLPATGEAHREWAEAVGAPLLIHKNSDDNAGWPVVGADRLS